MPIKLIALYRIQAKTSSQCQSNAAQSAGSSWTSWEMVWVTNSVSMATTIFLVELPPWLPRDVIEEMVTCFKGILQTQIWWWWCLKRSTIALPCFYLNSPLSSPSVCMPYCIPWPKGPHLLLVPRPVGNCIIPFSPFQLVCLLQLVLPLYECILCIISITHSLLGTRHTQQWSSLTCHAYFRGCPCELPIRDPEKQVCHRSHWWVWIFKRSTSSGKFNYFASSL